MPYKFHIARPYLLPLLGGLLILISLVWFFTSRSQATEYETVILQKGEISETVSATGTLQPVEVIDVGAQVAGKLSFFGIDLDNKPIDFGSKVQKGMVLARIDDSLYRAELSQAEARLGQAKAQLVQEEARLAQASREWTRAQKLGVGVALSDSAYHGYKSTFEVSQAAVQIAAAQIATAAAELERAQRNLDYCTITSPVDGVIIDRRVNIGQTVVSSLNAPSLFLIASDLSKIQIWVPVNEADIGKIQVGQKVTFSVPTYPGTVFEGKVGKIRLNAAMTQNVVTYTVEVETENPDGRLLPYLTADVIFQIGKEQDALKVPARALKFAPMDQPLPNDGTQSVWILDGKAPTQVKVTAGISDGAFTQVKATNPADQNKLAPGAQVITAEIISGSKDGARGGASPFMPQMRPGAGGRRN